METEEEEEETNNFGVVLFFVCLVLLLLVPNRFRGTGWAMLFASKNQIAVYEQYQNVHIVVCNYLTELKIRATQLTVVKRSAWFPNLHVCVPPITSFTVEAMQYV